MSEKLTLKRLNYFRTLALKKRKQRKKQDLKKPIKKRKRTFRDRMQTAPMNLFNRKDEGGNRMCRNVFCNKPPKDGYYCSSTCMKRFTSYYERRYMWANVRLGIFKRDKYTCKICRKFYNPKYLECDHIKPVSLLRYYGYTTLNLRAFDEYIYNEKNLRTLCKGCHKNITNRYMSNKDEIKRKLSS